MQGLGARIALRAVPAALLTGGVVVVFAYLMTGVGLSVENQQIARAMGWRIAGVVAGLSLLLLVLLEWIRWRRDRLAPPPGQPPTK